VFKHYFVPETSNSTSPFIYKSVHLMHPSMCSALQWYTRNMTTSLMWVSADIEHKDLPLIMRMWAAKRYIGQVKKIEFLCM
jgi:hypothetical protein